MICRRTVGYSFGAPCTHFSCRSAPGSASEPYTAHTASAYPRHQLHKVAHGLVPALGLGPLGHFGESNLPEQIAVLRQGGALLVVAVGSGVGWGWGSEAAVTSSRSCHRSSPAARSVLIWALTVRGSCGEQSMLVCEQSMHSSERGSGVGRRRTTWSQSVLFSRHISTSITSAIGTFDMSTNGGQLSGYT